MKSFTLFEPVFQELRIRKVISHIPRGGVHVDLGCDQPQVLIDRIHDEMDKCIGIDIVVKPHRYANVEILQQNFVKTITLPSNSADIITILAVLEHLKHPEEIIKECYRILKKGGVLLITVPSPSSRPILECFAVLGVVRKEMIEQHENYFTKQRLAQMCGRVGFKTVLVTSFELGLNTFVKAMK